MRKKKEKPDKIDGLSPDDIRKLRIAIRRVWAWSHPRKLCIKRATDEDGWQRCESCKVVVPKIFPDHIHPVGQMDGGYIDRMFCPSTKLQALCSKCHRKKTAEERRFSARKKQ